MGERVASQSARRPIYRVAALRRGRRGAWSSTVPGLGVGWKTPSSVHATTLAPQGRRGAAKFGHDQLAPTVTGSGPSLDAMHVPPPRRCGGKRKNRLHHCCPTLGHYKLCDVHDIVQ